MGLMPVSEKHVKQSFGQAKTMSLRTLLTVMPLASQSSLDNKRRHSFHTESLTSYGSKWEWTYSLSLALQYIPHYGRLLFHI